MSVKTNRNRLSLCIVEYIGVVGVAVQEALFDRLCGVEGGEGVYIERSVGDVDRAVQCGGTGRVRGRERKEEAGSVWWGVCVRRALDGREHRAVCRTSRNGKACRGPRGPERRGRSRGASYSVVRAGRNSEAQRSERHGAGVRCVQCLQGEHSREFPNLLSVSCPPIALEIKWALSLSSDTCPKPMLE